MKTCPWSSVTQAVPGGSHSCGRGLRQYNKGLERDLGGRAGRGGRDSQPAGQPSAAQTVPGLLLHPPSLPPISPENGMLKTGCVWNLFRKRVLFTTAGPSHKRPSVNTWFPKVSVQATACDIFFFTYPSCFNFLHKLFYFRIIFDLQRERREFPQTPHPALPDADASHSSGTCVVTKKTTIKTSSLRQQVRGTAGSVPGHCRTISTGRPVTGALRLPGAMTVMCTLRCSDRGFPGAYSSVMSKETCTNLNLKYFTAKTSNHI